MFRQSEVLANSFSPKRNFQNDLIAETNFPQIFKIQNSYGLQFHPEINKDLFTTWYSSELSKKELMDFNVEKESSNLFKHSDNLKEKMLDFYSLWIES